MFDHPALAKQFFLAGYHVVDLRADSEARIQQDKQVALAELVLKARHASQGMCARFPKTMRPLFFATAMRQD